MSLLVKMKISKTDDLLFFFFFIYVIHEESMIFREKAGQSGWVTDPAQLFMEYYYCLSFIERAILLLNSQTA